MPNSYDFNFASHVGIVRKNNEDYFGEKKLAGGHVFVVCDGMGGHSGGEIASKKAVECIIDYFTRSRGENAVQMIHEAIKFANSQVHGFATTYPEYTGMGTTCVVAYLTQDKKFYYGHVGDSRLYLQTSKGLTTLTKDHSYVQFLVDTGEIEESQMETHPSKNQILRALGIDEVVKPEVCPEPLSPSDGDLFLLCSDGLNGMIDKEKIQSLLTNKENKSLALKAQTLIQAALDGGGKDNVTVGLIGFSGETKEPTLEVTQEHSKKSLSVRIQKLLILLILVLAGIYAGIKFWKAKEPNESNETELLKEQGNTGSGDQTTTEEATTETKIEADDSMAAKNKAAADSIAAKEKAAAGAKVKKDQAAEKAAKGADSIKRLKNTKLGTHTP
jgi:serine/threonine protein phosphatase PrpC